MERSANGNIGKGEEKGMKERILDVGIGTGGQYLPYNSDNYWGVDINMGDLRFVKEKSSIPVVRASGKGLSFKEKTFKTLVIYFPLGSLLKPGLESYIPVLPWAENKKELKPEVSRKPQWYGEFARVLEDGGTLEVWGDHTLLNDEVKKQSSPFFDIGAEEEVEDYQLES